MDCGIMLLQHNAPSDSRVNHNLHKEGNDTKSSIGVTATDTGSGDELVTMYVKTSQLLQEKTQDFENRLKKSGDHIKCLQTHITLLHDQLAQKNRLIRSISSSYVSLKQEKQNVEEKLQQKVDKLREVLEVGKSNNISQLQKLLTKQIIRNELLDKQNKRLVQHLKKLCREKLG